MAVINSLRALKGVTAPEELKKGDGFTLSSASAGGRRV